MPSLEPFVRWRIPFYVKDDQGVRYIKIDTATREEGAHMYGRLDPLLVGRRVPTRIGDLVRGAVAGPL